VKRPRQLPALWLVAVLFVVACVVLGACSGAWLAPGPYFGSRDWPPLIEGDRLLDCLPREGKRSGPLPEGVRLYTNTDLTFRAVAPRAGETHLSVVARGRPLDGVWPLLTVHVDGDFRRAFHVDTRQWWIYRVNLHLSPGEHHFRLSYVNDRPGFPAKRDVDLRLVAIGDPPAADPSWTEPIHGPPGSPGLAGPLHLSDTSHVVAAEGFDLDSGSGILDGARVLWSNGYLGRTVVAAQEGRWRLTVSARGDLCDGAGPRVVVLAGAEQWAELRVEDADFTEHVVDLILEPGTQEVQLAYVNDSSVPGGCDRNLHVAEMRLEPLGVFSVEQR
jgi:hypothetical protein